jgi:hypothetical protein
MLTLRRRPRHSAALAQVERKVLVLQALERGLPEMYPGVGLSHLIDLLLED